MVISLICHVDVLCRISGQLDFDEMESAILSNDIDALKYRKEYNSKWPTGFLLQLSVMFRR